MLGTTSIKGSTATSGLAFASTTPSRMDGRYLFVLLFVIHEVVLATPPPTSQQRTDNVEYLFGSTDKRPNVSDLYRLLRTLRSDKAINNMPGSSFVSRSAGLRSSMPMRRSLSKEQPLASPYRGPHDIIVPY